MPLPDDPSIVIAFGPFRVYPHLRVMLRDGQAVPLGGRTFDLLLALLQTPGVPLDKEELLKRAWPGRVVEENSLQAQVSALRKALAPHRDLILTVAGRGYQFVGQVDTAVAPALPQPAALATNLPSRTSDLIGRDAELGELAELVMARRMVTLTGPGGIGKTQLCFELARQLAQEFPGGVHVAELAAVAEAGQVAATVAAVLGLQLEADDILADRIGAMVGNQAMLLVLDCCEHVITAAAQVAEAVLRASPALRVIATSREPLRTEGEAVYRLPALSVPAEDDDPLGDPLRSGAMRLFVARARALEPRFALDQTGHALASAICRRLDGIPLAIEMAAARAATLGVAWVASRLDDRFSMLTTAQRTVRLRHQTLRATLDWSYELLSDTERGILQMLAVFVGRFTLDAASAIAASPGITGPDIEDGLTSLVDKSLVMPQIVGASMRYRLLETTRAYAFEKLQAGGLESQVRLRHAVYFGGRFRHANEELRTLSKADWVAAYRPLIDDVRLALDRDFGAGDALRGAQLLDSASALFFELRLFDECRRRVEQAMLALEQSPDRDVQLALLQLSTVRAAALMHARGPKACRDAWQRCFELAAELRDAPRRLRASWGLWWERLASAEPRDALAEARRFADLVGADGTPAEVLTSRRLLGVSLHYLGDQGAAEKHMQHVLAHYIDPVDRSAAVGLAINQGVEAAAVMLRICWLRGEAEQAVRLCAEVFKHVVSGNSPLYSSCHVLAECCIPLALWSARWEEAEQLLAQLRLLSTQLGAQGWQPWCRCLTAALEIRRELVSPVLSMPLPLRPRLLKLREALVELQASGYVSHRTELLGLLAEGLARAGDTQAGLACVDEALGHGEASGEAWCLPELLRVKATVVLAVGGAQAQGQAAALFTQGITLASEQQAVMWQLRCGIGLATLLRAQGHSEQARDVLAPVCARFTESALVPDLQEAQTLLASWPQS